MAAGNPAVLMCSRWILIIHFRIQIETVRYNLAVVWRFLDLYSHFVGFCGELADVVKLDHDIGPVWLGTSRCLMIQ